MGNKSRNLTAAEQKIQSGRKQARRLMERAGKVKKGDGKHVDHIDHNPTNNALSNLRVRSAKANSSDNPRKKKKPVKKKAPSKAKKPTKKKKK